MKTQIKKSAPSAIVIALAVFFFTMALIILMLVNFGNEYGSEIINNSYSSHYVGLTNITTIGDEMYKAVNSGEGLTIIGVGEVIIKGSFQTISLIVKSIGLVPFAILNVMLDLDIPSEVGSLVMGLIITLITIIVVIGIINYISRIKPL